MHSLSQNYSSLRVLFLPLEFETWRFGRSLTYATGIGIEEGFLANRVRYATINTFCLKEIRTFCRNRQFDQIWMHVFPGHISEDLLELVSELAPIRVGLVMESLRYSPDELKRAPWFSEITQHFDKIKGYLTHIATCDEKDAEYLNEDEKKPSFWWPQAIPARYIWAKPPRPKQRVAVFPGNAYEERKAWLKMPELVGLLEMQRSSEDGTIYPFLFNGLQTNIQRYLARPWLPAHASAIRLYLYLLRFVRRSCFSRWLQSLQRGAAVVNLPHFVKTYSGRVAESMAAGRPVISWEIPDRPRNRSLFADGEEILLFDKAKPDELSNKICLLLSDQQLADRLVSRAEAKIRRWHTMERRVSQFLFWLTTGDKPTYG